MQTRHIVALAGVFVIAACVDRKSKSIDAASPADAPTSEVAVSTVGDAPSGIDYGAGSGGFGGRSTGTGGGSAGEVDASITGSGGMLALGGTGSGDVPGTGGTTSSSGTSPDGAIGRGGSAAGGTPDTGGVTSNAGSGASGSKGTGGATGSCTSTSCGAGSYCDGTNCVPLKTTGGVCLSGDECSSGYCVDSRCCGEASCETCQSCTGPGGTCVAVTNAEDSDSCGGVSTCDAIGACKKKAGQTCTAATQCVGGNCADGVCCNTACDRSCEYCNGGTPGTCGFITGAPMGGHPACAGTGPCQGSCNGTKASCAFPGAETTCRQPSCTGSTVENLAVCDGLGNCPAVSTTPCSPFVCGTTSCLTSCSSSSECVAGAACIGAVCQTCGAGQSVCGNACVNLQTDPSHCGDCTTSCSSGHCLNSGCVQCTQVSHCPAGYQACDSTTHTCLCRQKSSSNLLTNPGFDGAVSGWTMVGGAAYQATVDADGCPDSGSVWLSSVGHEVKQCRPASPSTLYSFGFRFKGTGPGETPTAFCAMIFYAGTGCTTPSATSNITYVTPGGTNWVQGAASATSPPDTGSVIVDCVGQYGFGYYDQLYLSSTNATF